MEDNEEKKCEHCKKNVAVQNFTLHSLHCMKFIQLCEICCEPVHRNEFDAHLIESHSIEDCSYCGLPIEKWKLLFHKEDECYKRPASCEFCDERLPFNDMMQHKNICGSRTKECLSCHSYVKNKEQVNHLKNCEQKNKIRKLIVCKYCEMDVLQEKYLDHEISCGSRTEKCNSCTKYVTLKDLEHHRSKCGQEKKRNDSYGVCEHCEVKIPSSMYNEHVSKCDDRIEKCSSCYDFVKLKDIDSHRNICEGSILKEDDLESAEKSNSVENGIELNEEKSPIPCTFCNVLFPLDCLNDHTETCVARADQCPDCEEIFVFQNKEQHKRTCKPMVDTEKCFVCDMDVPSSIYKSHYEECFSTNTFSASHNYAESMPSYPAEKVKYDVNLKSCPYCSKQVQSKQFENHKMYCSKALNVCQFCEETFHVKETMEHYENCDAYKMSKGKSTVNGHEQHLCDIHTDENFGRENEKGCFCLFCQNHIVKEEFEKHINLCEAGKKLCKFCAHIFDKNKEKSHLKICGALQEEINTGVYSSLHPQLQPSKKNDLECIFCKKVVSYKDFDSHVGKCRASKICTYCKARISKRDVDHIAQCFKNLEKGAKPKYKEVLENKQNKSGVFKAVLDWWNLLGSSNDESYSRNQSRHYSGFNNTRPPPISHFSARYQNWETHKEFQPSAPENEEILIPCEFCNKRIPMDEIIKHETACKPELVSLPSARFEKQEINETLQAKGDSVQQKEVLDSEDLNYEETSQISYNEVIPPQVQKEHIINYTYLQNLNPKPYAAQSSEENQQRHSLSKYDNSEKVDRNKQPKSPSFKENETVDCFNEAKKQTVESSKKSFVLESEKSSHGKDNHANAHKSVIYKADKYSDQTDKKNLISESTEFNFYNSNKITEPGEFLKNYKTYEQFNSKKSEETTVLDPSISHSWQNIDGESNNIFEKEVSDNYWNKSEESKSLKHYESETINHSRKKYGEKIVHDDKQFCNSKRLKNEMNIITIDKFELSCPTKNFSVGNFDEGMEKLKTKVNQKEFEISNYLSSNSFKSNYDSIRNDHSNVSDVKVEKEPGRNTDCYKRNKSLILKAGLGYNKEYSIISSSKMQGPVKIEQLSLKKTNNEMDKCLEPVGKLNANEDNVFEKSMEQISSYPNVLQRYQSFSSSDNSFEEKQKNHEEIKQVNLKHNQSLNRLKYFNRKQYSENEILADQPMDIDDENNYAIKKSRNLSTQLENILQTSKYIDDPEYNIKDNSLENYMRFLENDKPENSSCQTCNNEICVCKIEKSILLQRSNPFSDVPKTNDYNTQLSRRLPANIDYLENTSISNHEKIISSHQKKNETSHEREGRMRKVSFSSNESSEGE